MTLLSRVGVRQYISPDPGTGTTDGCGCSAETKRATLGDVVEAYRYFRKIGRQYFSRGVLEPNGRRV